VIVPQYWAEGRAAGSMGRRKVTARRFGWSDHSQDDAQQMADQRAEEALDRRLRGEKLPTREPKVPYLGASGTPIREEIISRHGQTIITRNSYGALCLNSPDVMFTDIDLPDDPVRNGPRRVLIGLLCLALASTVLLVFFQLWHFGFMSSTASTWLGGFIPVSLILIGALITANLFVHQVEKIWKDPPWIERAAVRAKRADDMIMAMRQAIDAFIANHPDWHLRIYRTPAGLRLLTMHSTFSPSELAVREAFATLGADPSYVALCQAQNCFRARVSPKPWRVGLSKHIKPRPGVWPVKPERLPARAMWVQAYLQASQHYSSCQFIAAVGSSLAHPSAIAVRDLHDTYCHALANQPLA
jgi:hypothetical protein